MFEAAGMWLRRGEEPTMEAVGGGAGFAEKPTCGPTTERS